MPARLRKNPTRSSSRCSDGEASAMPRNCQPASGKAARAVVDPSRRIAAGRQPEPVFVIDQRAGLDQSGFAPAPPAAIMTRGPKTRPARRGVGLADDQRAQPQHRIADPELVADREAEPAENRRGRPPRRRPRRARRARRARPAPATARPRRRADRRHRPPATRSGCAGRRRSARHRAHRGGLGHRAARGQEIALRRARRR